MSEKATAPAAAQETKIDLTLEEFCSRLSVTDRRPELIAGFFHSETVAAHFKDSEAAFASRFTAFVNKPV